ncbi:MAG: AbrB/MazE/SpoVT family DNA-binding domain-containing protein [Actinomycetota bacterium]
MGKRTRVREKGQVTIPADIRKAAHLEAGDPIAIEMTGDGILLRPMKVIDSTQAWFWTPTWQEKERQASEDIRTGRVTRYLTDEEFLETLNR